MASSLASVAEISNGVFIVVILGCFVAMVIFILRRREGLYGTSVRYVHNTKNARRMICVHNPFVLTFKDALSASLTDIPVNITIQTQCMLQAFWGVSVENLGWLLSLPWTSLKALLCDESPPSGFSLSKSAVLNIDVCWNSAIHMSPLEEISSNDLGDVPRTKYPLVIALVRTAELHDTEDTDTVVAAITVMHIKDSLCKMESQFLAQYLKQASGQTCSLKRLYMSSGATSQEAYNSSSHGFEEIDSSCVVCQSLPVTRALLPCRHTCICYHCFPRLERCPVCRSLIQSYFCIQDEKRSDVEETAAPSSSLLWQQRWEQLNEQLNQWLGLVDRF